MAQSFIFILIPYHEFGALAGKRFYDDYDQGLVAPPSIVRMGTGASNLFFRHLSVGYVAQPSGVPNWNYSLAFDWRLSGLLPVVKDQQTCSELTFLFLGFQISEF